MPEKNVSKARKFLDFLHFNGLSFQIMVAFILLISVAISFLSIAFYNYNIADLEQTSINNTRLLLSEINYSIDSYIENIKSMGRVVVDNSDVRQLLSFYNKHDLEALDENETSRLEMLMSRASSHMNIVANTRAEITNIAIVPKNGTAVLSDKDKKINPYSDYRVSDWFLQPLAHKDLIYVSPPHVQNLIAGEYRWVISISEVVTDPTSGEVTGVMLIDLNYAAIEAICDKAQLGTGRYIYIIDGEGNIITHPQQQLIYSGIRSEPVSKIIGMDESEPMQDGRFIYIKSESEITGWSAIGTINSYELVGNRTEILIFYALVTMATLFFSVIVAILLSTIITKPLRTLQSSMDKVRKGDLSERSEIQSNNEIGQLSDSFNIMISQIQNLMSRAIADEKEKRISEIKALQAQINPHFLYNTLDTIIWMSASGKNEEVMEVTSALAHLFRTSISQGESFVTVETEIENIKNYLLIQKMRYKDRLRYSVEVEQDALKFLTPKLILQPIVENALYHGIKLSPEGGTVDIKILRRDKSLVFSVRDNGVGMPEGQMNNILKEKQVSKNTGSGIGVINVNNRIQLLFGENYGLRYSAPDNIGILVEIVIPIIEEEGKYNA